MQNRSSTVWWWLSLDSAVAIWATFLCIVGERRFGHSETLQSALAERLSIKNFLLFGVFLILWTGIHQLSGLYVEGKAAGKPVLTFRVVAASALGSIFFLVFPLFSNGNQSPVFVPVTIFFLAALLGSLGVRAVVWPLLPQVHGALTRPIRTLIVGSGPIARKVYRSLIAEPKDLYRPLGFVDSIGPHTSELPSLILGDLDSLEQILMTTPVDEVIVALPLRSCYDQIQQSIHICERAGIAVTYDLAIFSHRFGFSHLHQRSLQPYVSWRPSRVEEFIGSKRAIDLLGAAAVLTVLFPLLVAVAVAIKLSSPGPVMFVQERCGLNKQRFRMFKFRTMVADAEVQQAALECRNEAHGPVFKIRNDPRVTPLGRLLRKTSLDELPQLINVLKGEMSLVGPRPLPLRDVAKFTDPWLMRRFSVKPGLTCLWQVQGRSDTSFDQWIAFDLEYIDTWSPLLDCKILLLTIPAVLRGSGAM